MGDVFFFFLSVLQHVHEPNAIMYNSGERKKIFFESSVFITFTFDMFENRVVMVLGPEGQMARDERCGCSS